MNNPISFHKLSSRKPSIALLFFLALALMSVMLPSCHSTRTASESTVLASDREVAWTSFYAPVSVNISNPMKMAASGRATFENGKYIHISMRFLGMEVVVIYIDNDSVYFVDKYHKYIFAEPLHKILGEKYKNLTLADIQKILLGQKSIPANDNIRISPSFYVSTPAGQVASRMSIDAITPQADISGGWEWSQYEAKWNDPGRTASFKVPENYTVITLDNLKSMLKNFSF